MTLERSKRGQGFFMQAHANTKNETNGSAWHLNVRVPNMARIKS